MIFQEIKNETHLYVVWNDIPVQFFLLTVNAWGAPYISFDSNRTGQSDIYIIDTNGKNLRNLTNHPADDWSATWAPDGRSFAFASNRDGNSEIYIKTFNVAKVRRLTNHPEFDSYSCLVT